MTAYWCILIAILFPYIFTILAKTGPNFNNASPREYLDKIQGWRKHSHWVQLNSFEINPAFAVAVIIARQLHAPIHLINYLAITFLITRVLYAICYISNKSALRTLFWMAGFACVIALFLISL